VRPGHDGSFARREPIVKAFSGRNGVVNGFAPAAVRPLCHHLDVVPSLALPSGELSVFLIRPGWTTRDVLILRLLQPP